MTYENINDLFLKQVDNINRVSANASIQGQIFILRQVMTHLQSEIQKLEKREKELSVLPTKQEPQQMSLFPETMND
jgi:prefoldin subunit 5